MPHQPDESCEDLLHAAGCSDKVVAHCRAVRDVALGYAELNALVRVDLVRKGSMLHDIGRGSTHTILHAQQGADLLRDRGISEEIARIVECHTGAGLTSDECTLLRLLPIDCMPQTGEEKLVANADNLMKGRTEVGICRRLESAMNLDRKIRYRIYRLWLFGEQVRRTPLLKSE